MHKHRYSNINIISFLVKNNPVSIYAPCRGLGNLVALILQSTNQYLLFLIRKYGGLILLECAIVLFDITCIVWWTGRMLNLLAYLHPIL